MSSYRFDQFASDYLDAKLDRVNAARIKVVCMFHDDHDPSMSFHRDEGYFKCFTCGAKGGIVKLARQLGLTVKGDGYIDELEDPEEDVRSFLRRVDDLSNPPVTEESWLPDTWLRRFQVRQTEYWAQRGLLPGTVAQWQLGYDSLSNHAVIPIRDRRRRLVGVIRRQLSDGAQPKYLNPKGYNKRTTFFGAWRYRPSVRSRGVVLVEGPLDTLNVCQAGYAALGLLGSDFQDAQVTQLHRLGIERIVMFPDADAAGTKLAESIYWKTHDDFELAIVPYGRYDPADPGAMTIQQVRAAVQRAQPLTTW